MKGRADSRRRIAQRRTQPLIARARAIEIASECDLAVDVEADEISVGKTRSRGRPTAYLLLARLIDAGGAPVSREILFHSLRGVEYHAFDHRNTLYVTVPRPKTAR